MPAVRATLPFPHRPSGQQAAPPAQSIRPYTELCCSRNWGSALDQSNRYALVSFFSPFRNAVEAKTRNLNVGLHTVHHISQAHLAQTERSCSPQTQLIGNKDAIARTSLMGAGATAPPARPPAHLCGRVPSAGPAWCPPHCRRCPPAPARSQQRLCSACATVASCRGQLVNKLLSFLTTAPSPRLLCLT